jgi:hypothetical protein
MNAPAAVLRFPRAPFTFRVPPLRPAALRRRQAAARGQSQHRGLLPLPQSRHASSEGLSASFVLLRQMHRCLRLPASARRSGAAVRSIARHFKIAWRLAAAAAITAMIALAIVNNQRTQLAAAMALQASSNETIVYWQLPPAKAAMEDEGEPAGDESSAAFRLNYPRMVHTITFANPASPATSRSAAVRGAAIARVGAFVAFPGTQAQGAWPGRERGKGIPSMDEVDRYLWEVYQRAPIKRDHSGDFTWKDPAAASRMGMSLPEYVIVGMDPDFREQLYHAGRSMDAAGIQWSMLSAFRDDYRQRLAQGFKARVGRSLHGGSATTGGYGHGRAVDLTNADGDAEVVWRWIDVNGAKFGLYRPIPGPDPAHVQSRGDSRKLALALRENRLRTAEAGGAPDPSQAPKANVVAKASW